MSFVKGLFNFVLMLCLSILLALGLLYGIFNQSVLSYDRNQEMLESTDLSEEITDELLVRYTTKLESIAVDDGLLADFVETSSEGVLAYVLLESEQMPTVDVAFLKTYAQEKIEEEISTSLTENVDIDAMITYIKAVPDGQSISKGLDMYLESQELTINEKDLDLARDVFLNNKTLEADALKAVLLTSLASEYGDISQMKENLSLQQFFDDLMPRNPFTVLRQGYEVVDKNLSFYLPVFVILIVLLMTLIEFKLSNSITWFVLSLLVAIVPLQVLRLADFFMDKDYIDVLGQFTSYKTFMMDRIIERLNVYTLVVLLIMVVLIITKRILRQRVDDKVMAFVEGRKTLVGVVRASAILLVVLGTFLVSKNAEDFNRTYYNDLQEIQVDDFDPVDLDQVLGDGLNVDFDF